MEKEKIEELLENIHEVTSVLLAVTDPERGPTNGHTMILACFAKLKVELERECGKIDPHHERVLGEFDMVWKDNQTVIELSKLMQSENPWVKKVVAHVREQHDTTQFSM